MSALAMAQESKGSAQSARKTAGNLRINQPDDAYEREADRIAEEVMAGARRMPSWSLSRVAMPHVQRQCTCGGECEDCKKDKKDKQEKLLQREPSGHESAPAFAPLSVGTVLRGSGRPLDAETRVFMESGFGHDFGRVRIFADEQAAGSARDVHANAYTVGEKIVFNRGRYTPGSETGRRLLAHELAHVVQQGLGIGAQVQREKGDEEVEGDDDAPKRSDSVLKRALRAADAVVAGGGNLQEVVLLANGLNAYEMKFFLDTYKGTPLIARMHDSAMHAQGLGDQSNIALKTEADYKVAKKKQDFEQRKDIARQNGWAEPKEGDPPPPPPRPLTVEEKKQKCATGQLPGLKTFPIQLKQGMTEFNSAPLSATPTQGGVMVSQPQNSVLGNRAFRRDTKTLPLQVFTGGITLANDDVVRVRMYDSDGKPTGKTGCLTGAEMLKVGAASDNATLLAIGSTVVNAASVFVPGGGTVAAKVGTAALQIGVNEGFDVAGQANLVHYGLQDKIDWAQIAFDTLFQIITAGVAHGAGPVAESLADSVSAKAGSAYTRSAIKFGVMQVLPTATILLQTTANQLFNSLRGQAKPMTVREFAAAVGEALAQHLLQQVLHAAVGPDAEQQQKNKAHADEAREASATLDQPPATVAQHEGPAPQVKKQVAEHHENETAAPRKSPSKQEMEPEGKSPVKAVPKEEVLDEAPVKIDGQDHEVVAGKKGFGLCSEPPCPAIPIVYKEELDSNPEFAARYKAIRKQAETDVKGANHEAVKLVGDMEKVRDIGRNARNAAQVPKLDHEAPTDPDRGTSREQWKASERNRRVVKGLDAAIDRLDDVATSPKVKGGKKSGYYMAEVDDAGNIKKTRIPGEGPAHVDMDADPNGPDIALPKKAGETGRQAADRVRTVIGKKLSDIASLKTLWEDSRASVLSRNKLTKDNYGELYDKVRDGFWRRVTGSSAKPKTPDEVKLAAASGDAKKMLTDAGFNVGGDRAATLAGVTGVGDNEITISLDHLDEKAIGDNWKKALDADNLQMEFALPNSDRENRQMRHPELRPAAGGGKP